MNPHIAPITARLNLPLIWRWNAENERAIRINRGRPKRESMQDWRDRTLAARKAAKS